MGYNVAEGHGDHRKVDSCLFTKEDVETKLLQLMYLVDKKLVSRTHYDNYMHKLLKTILKNDVLKDDGVQFTKEEVETMLLQIMYLVDKKLVPRSQYDNYTSCILKKMVGV